MDGINALLVLRAAQAVVALIIMSIFAAVASSYDSLLGSCPSSVAFMVFISVWTLLVVLPFTIAAPRYFPKIAHPYAMMGAESTTTVFYFCGFIAVANMIRTLNVCRGLVCHSAIAGTVFAAFEFALFAASSYFATNHVISSRGGSSSFGVAKDVESLRSTHETSNNGNTNTNTSMMSKVRALWARRAPEGI